MTTGTQRSRQPKPLAAGAFQGEISSFRLHLAAEGKAAKTVRSYTEAVQWFAAAHLLRETSRTGLGPGQRPGYPALDGLAARRQIMIRGNGGKARIVRIGHETARSLDRVRPGPAAARAGISG